MSESADYIEHGWALCQFARGSKGQGNIEAWNERGNAICDASEIDPAKNIGLLHAWSGTCAIDIDDFVEARDWLGRAGVLLDALLSADDAVQIKSGRNGRAKLLYRVPPGVDPLSLPHVPISAPTGGKKWIELRCATKCGTKSLQDVLPPSIHPETKKPYEWHGDWRELPELPAALLELWRKHQESPKQRAERGATGPGDSAEVMDAYHRLQSAGLKPYRCGDGFRSHCPHHGGESGTSLSVDESSDGRALFHCFAGCTQQEVLTALNQVAPMDRGIAPISNFQQLKAASDARKAAKVEQHGGTILPPLPDELLNLPHGLGEMQRWVLSFMSHPSPAAAGFACLATLAHFAMAHVGVASRDGLGLNEQFLLLAPTGFGKEALRKPIEKIAKALPDYRPTNAGNLWPSGLPEVQFSAPASQQGLHRLFETNRAQTFLADEFAEWLAHSANDSHKQQALGHAMQAYTKAYSTLAVPHIASREHPYTPVENPRMLVFATSTAERLLESINASQADSGALNRFVILVAEPDRIQKQYGIKPGLFTPPARVMELIAWVTALGETIIDLSPESEEYHDQHDSAVIEVLAHRDPRLAKRLTEQALKIAGLIALSEGRTTIDVRDLATAFAIREGLYHRAAALIGFDGALSGMHSTGRAVEQIRALMQRKPFIYISHLHKDSRQYGKLSVSERSAVLSALHSEGVARKDGGRLVSLIHEQEAA
ncbi:bifunctional DNA primase/polymerase [Lysobacter enzymogenes]|uniref:bifunctional DNA primase/polymerase n=1 Tax=Lysobacter enzymogenes TaxID=69 RepID=UPI001A979D94|nr:bifunctional DNA primase/polymerase [Lysobacter enzymogenes]QQP97939.1 bifunctional DNA primase/polymerase [Lysobacter enzymogenes]